MYIEKKYDAIKSAAKRINRQEQKKHEFWCFLKMK